MGYKPSDKLLSVYADLLVNMALNSGEGVEPGEVVQCLVPDLAKPMYGALQRAILKAGAIPLMRLVATGFDRDYYELAQDKQLTFFPKRYLKERVKLIDHSIGIIAEHDLHELDGVSPERMMKAAESKKKMREWLQDKEYAGKFTWTLALYGTEAMAKEAGLPVTDYWQQIIEACYLDKADPKRAWKQLLTKQRKVIDALNLLAIDEIHVRAEGTDIRMTLGERRRFVGGGMRNVPSFEIFTSPDWRGTNGVMSFNQPLYRYGSLITDIRLEFRHGRVVQATAKKNQALLRQLIARPGADKVGEFSLTDSRFSPIRRFMANTLYDENVGGTYGNTHIALGSSYKDAYDGDPTELCKREWKRLGFNQSGEHCDMMSTTDRTVTAKLKSGVDKVIYMQGKFAV